MLANFKNSFENSSLKIKIELYLLPILCLVLLYVVFDDKKIVENETSLKFSKAMHALNRIGTKEDAAEMAAFLLSDKANFITGQIIAIDGGLSCLQPKIKI